MTLAFLKGFAQGFKDFSEVIIDIFNFILLLIVYILGIGITSIVAKILNKHFLDLKFGKGKSYWIERNITKGKKEDYYNQF